MVKSTEVKIDSEKFSLYITDYANKFEALQADWDGISYNKLKEKANAFVQKAKTVITMMNCLSEVCEKHEKYVEGMSSSKAKEIKKINSEAEAIEQKLYSIQDLENVTVGNSNFVVARFSTNLLNEVPVYSNKRGTFKLNSDITSGAFRTIRNNLDELITKVSAYDTSMENTPDFTVKIDQIVKKIIKNLEICANRVQNTIVAIDAVVNNHKRLQHNLIEYVTREESSKTDEQTTSKKKETTEKQTETSKKESTSTKKEETPEEEEQKEEQIVEAQLPVGQSGGYGGGYGGGQPEVTSVEPQPEVEVPVSTVPAATTPRVIKAQTKNNSADATAIIPLAGIGLVGAAGGVALLAKKKKEEEEEAEYLEDEEIEETEFNNNKKQQRSSRENKEWLHSLGLGISDDIDSSTIENDSVSIGANN